LQGRRITWFGDLLHESRNAADVLEQQGIRVPASSGQNRKGAAPDFQVHVALSGVIAGKFHNAPFRDSTSPMSHMGQLQTLASQQRAPGPFIITRTCRRVCRTYWQLNANQLSSDNGAKSLEAERDEELKAP